MDIPATRSGFLTLSLTEEPLQIIYCRPVCLAGSREVSTRDTDDIELAVLPRETILEGFRDF
jgi:hypothetical protein